MVGGGSRRDEGSLVINNTNVFAALETLKKKKKSDKERKSKGSSKSQAQSKGPEPQVFWAPSPLNTTSWADVDDDDDYYATTAPPQSVWGVSELQQSKEKPNDVEESESEEDILDDGDDDVEEEHDHEAERPVTPEPEVKKPGEVSVVPKEAERQLSKKERKKKELAELEALLADFGVAPKERNGQDESRGVPQVKKDVEADGDGEKKENTTVESKSAKKKKKKDKASKEVRESQDQPNSTDANNGPDEVTITEQMEEDTSTVDVKERLRKVASAKKKKSSKEMDAAARAAAQEAAARNSRLAAAKKKEKSHYNQQPVR
ncbi:hypothetical protein L6164_015805 [Bauhinia variegata]|uniref:Uncharacterized protein n=1 Tax=Bauhinia variegata TaxID=167791 RepID=A0ACB9NQH2_BAUVA|nr:hypothetical protein L6164_015805 [Bauhinia variegata]